MAESNFKTQQHPTKQKERAIERVRSESYLSVYASSAQLRVTLFDIQIAFGQILDATERKIKFEDQVNVTMSPQHAKVLANLLVVNVANYEKQFGKINLPKDAPGIDIEFEGANSTEIVDS